MLLVKLICRQRKSFSIGKDYTNQVSTIVHSDTLFSAICNNIRKLYGNEALEDFLDILKGGSKLKLTSCFHYIDIQKEGKYLTTLYFVPKPSIRFPFDKDSQIFFESNPKLFKKIEFVSFDIIEKLQNGEELNFSNFVVLDDRYLLDTKNLQSLGWDKFLEGDFEANRKEFEGINERISVYSITEEQKVAISRTKKDSIPFTWPKMTFNVSDYFVWHENNEKTNYTLTPGFYFLIKEDKFPIELMEKVRAAIILIMDQGIGGNRSLGCGLCDEITVIEGKNFPYHSLIYHQNSGGYMNLSLVFPSLNDLKKVKFFNLYDKSGYIYSADTRSQRFNDIKFIKEGAIFTEKVDGRLVQVASEEFAENVHKVFKNGLGFYVNIGKLEEAEQ
ncbi:MAG: type III-A CRISPR-associated RAMP protein Csm4 [Candidatus Lokiarchaeota archaeon]|nr:type III-A CRISPR-associated RAMP protein Csm4 [Candidatus Lokiarchaeota archaeon]